MSELNRLIEAMDIAFTSPNELDRNGETANLVDGLFAVARAIERRFDEPETVVAGVIVDEPADDDDGGIYCRFCGSIIGVRFGEAYAPGDDVCEGCQQKIASYLHETQPNRCVVCGSDQSWPPSKGDIWMEENGNHPFPTLFCARCVLRYPASLLKAQVDQFDYAMGLRTGEVVMFQTCRITGDWVHIEPSVDGSHGQPEGTRGLVFGSERGIDIRVDEIVWCCDAPFGS